jgi:FxsC-like protein
LANFDAFFSYAREDYCPYMDKFYRDLKEEVRLLLGAAKGDPILFRDEQDIDIGKPWRSEIINALQSAQVLVAVQTPRYFTRPYCGKEFGVMKTRESLLRTPSESIAAVIPVTWGPCVDLPAAVKQYQQAPAELPTAYISHGLLQLKRNFNKYRGEYFDCIRFFAEKIVTAVRAPRLPALEHFPDFDDAPDAFQMVPSDRSADQVSGTPLGPRCVRFFYAVGTRSHLRGHKSDCSRYDEERGEFWKPFLDARAIGVLAGMTASAHDFVVDLVKPDATLVREMESAADGNNLVIIIVDAWTLEKCDPIRASLEECDHRTSTRAAIHCAVLVAWNEADAETTEWRPQLKQRVEDTLSVISSLGETHFHPSIESASDFETVLAKTLLRLQTKILAYGCRKRVLPSTGFRHLPILDVHSESVNDG